MKIIDEKADQESLDPKVENQGMNSFLTTPLNVYRSFEKPSLVSTISLDDLIHKIKDSRLNVPAKGTKEYDRFKAQQNVVTVNGYFRDRPSYTNFSKSTGLIFCEIDTGKELSADDKLIRAIEYKNRFFNLPFVVCSYLSLSKTSVHFILKLDDDLSTEINPKFFRQLYKWINTNYFDSLLDSQCCNINRFTCLSSDENILIKESVRGLNKEDISTLHTTNNNEDINTYYTSDDNNADINAFYSIEKKDIKYSCPLFSYYPFLVERLLYKPVEDDHEGLLEYLHNYHEYPHRMGYKKHKYAANFRTHISEQHFFNDKDQFERNTPVFFKDGIDFCEWVVRPIKIKESVRKMTLLAFSRVVLFNTPFISGEQFTRTLLDFNRWYMETPLNTYEVEQVAEYNFEKFQSGEMEFNRGSMKIRKRYVWFSSFCNLKPGERISISRKVFKQNTTARIYTAIEELQGEKKITQKSIAKVAGISSRTVRRHFREHPELVDYCKALNPHIIKQKRRSKIENEIIQSELVEQTNGRTTFRELFDQIENRELINIYYRSFGLTEQDFVEDHVHPNDMEYLRFLVQTTEHWVRKKQDGSIIEVMIKLFHEITQADILTFLETKGIQPEWDVRDSRLLHFKKDFSLMHVIEEFHELCR